MKFPLSLFLATFIITSTSLATVQRQEELNISDCLATTSGRATITVVGQEGEKGSRGPVGLQGLRGIRGWRGEKGEKGVNGEAGRNGAKGEVGIGLQGNTGLPGAIGPRGYRGPDGERGQSGLPGPIGPRGYRGPDGVRGPSGPPGPPGVRGQEDPPGEFVVNLTDVQYKQIVEEVSKEMKQILQCKLPTSCKEMYLCKNATPSGYYNIWTLQGMERVYCEMNTTNCGNITGGWMRVANIDMTDENNTCPQGLTYTVASSTRMCTSLHSGGHGCSSVIFPTLSVPYTKVCGRAHGYQHINPDGFNVQGQPLDGYYVDGLSVTNGSPRSHIWTFAAGVSKDFSYGGCCSCPCAAQQGRAAPSFIGENFFCESGNTGGWETKWYFDDPLWDSQGCLDGSTCCDRGGSWFSTTLSQEASDNIELRMCFYRSNKDIGIEQFEIYTY